MIKKYLAQIFILELIFLFVSVYIVTTESFDFPAPLKDAFALFFYTLIITIPPTYFIFFNRLINNNISKSRSFYIAFISMMINVLALFYLNKTSNKDQFYYHVIEGVMNYSNFIIILFIFPIQIVYFGYQTIKIVQSKKMNIMGILPLTFFTFILSFSIFEITRTVILFYVSCIALISLIIIIIYLNYRKQLIAENKEEIELDINFNEIELKLIEVMEKDKLFLNPKLTILECARAIKSNEKYLSNYLNQIHLSNFNTFVNNYRIEEAKKILISEESEKYTIETLAKMSGFNSKSSFNTLFKKVTGKTPSEYKKEMSK